MTQFPTESGGEFLDIILPQSPKAKGLESFIQEFATHNPEHREQLESLIFIDPWLYDHDAQKLHSAVKDFVERYPDRKLLFISFLPPQMLAKTVEDFETFLALPKVLGFVRLPFTGDTLQALFNEAKDGKEEAVYTLRRRYSIDAVLSTLRHDLNNCLRRRSDGAEESGVYKALIAKARDAFAFDVQAPDEEVEAFVLKSAKDVVKGREGDIDGVYCDVDGTLLRHDGTVNEKVLAMLADYEAGGKAVHVWTGGDLDRARGLLAGSDAARYPLFAKADFAGARAEIVIDNDPQDVLDVETGIRAKTFIRVIG